MVYLLDSNAVSDLMREHQQFCARAYGLPQLDRLVSSVIVRGEILFGLERMPLGKKRSLFEEKATSIFSWLALLPVSSAVSDEYARVKSRNEAKGLPLNDNDLWIAATAIAVDATLVTRDSDLTRVDGLRVEDWTT